MPSIMVQGCTSDSGKSTIATGICRWLLRKGYSVAPFKPQNMALNSAVTVDSGEIGRAQAVQAQAAGLKPVSDMNPVLLKPNSETGSQVIIQGRALTDMEAKAYHGYKPTALKYVMESYRRLSSKYDYMVIEGAGSPAEINLREGDIANMGFAEEIDAPVILVADIDRGGVFAHLAGTCMVLSQSEQNRIKGFIINKFRGDPDILTPGLDWLENYTGKPVLGVLPYIVGFHLEAEDAIDRRQGEKSINSLKIVIPVTPRISNHTDFDPLRMHPQADVTFVRKGEAVPEADLVILAGSKSVRTDLKFLLDEGWDERLKTHLRYGGKVMGICGGYQMLGKVVHDPLGYESKPGSSPALGLLDLETTLEPEKQLLNVEATLTLDNAPVKGYEIHAGVTNGDGLKRPFLEKAGGERDGAISEDNQVAGSYLHGVFESQEGLAAILRWAGLKDVDPVDYWKLREEDIDALADMIETRLDSKRLLSIIQAGNTQDDTRDTPLARLATAARSL
ncbi:MAG: cobyric acid synthase [Deltaproteobacteria bacterium]|jgi:adenosylcobyric acid synthase|nr:cobyric acid synthase [Deltaproteobacteria bacterium]